MQRGCRTRRCSSHVGVLRAADLQRHVPCMRRGVQARGAVRRAALPEAGAGDTVVVLTVANAKESAVSARSETASGTGWTHDGDEAAAGRLEGVHALEVLMLLDRPEAAVVPVDLVAGCCVVPATGIVVVAGVVHVCAGASCSQHALNGQSHRRQGRRLVLSAEAGRGSGR